jgi:uncharacterized membrane protein YjjP (DUF1212 family)
MKLEVSAGALLSLAVALISLGVNFLRSGDTASGAVCVLVGFGLICATIYLVERGIISRLAGGRQR